MIRLDKKEVSSARIVFEIPRSKSISNRLLLLQAIFPTIKLEGLSTANDTKVLQRNVQLIQQASNETIVLDVEDAGTAFRFLLAYACISEGSFQIVGKPRLYERPIAPLVDALRALGASIDYMQHEGFAPLSIHGKKMQGGRTSIDASMSSQFITSLLMIGSSLEQGLVLTLNNKIVSDSYIHMTVKLMEALGLVVIQQGVILAVPPGQEVGLTQMNIEADWSSAGYAYACMAGMKKGSIYIPNLSLQSLQGDSIIAEWASWMGIETMEEENGIRIFYQEKKGNHVLSFDCLSCPDLVPTILSMCALMQQEAVLTGLDTLVHKETNRVEALQQEWKKFGCSLIQEGDMFYFKPNHISSEKVISVTCYADHRMAMAFAPMAYVVPVEIDTAGVVEKSFPDFWNQIVDLGIQITQL